MLNNQVRPNLGKEFYPEPAIGVELRDDPYGSLGRYSSPKWRNNKWTNGIFLYDGRRPHEL